jgi:hypothetical protein
MPASPRGYCLVQHSAAGYGGDTSFARGLETRSVGPADAARVSAAGGVVLPSWELAETLAEREMYPAGYDGLVPAAGGRFAALTVDGLAVYLPSADVEPFAALAATWTGTPAELGAVLDGARLR